MTELDEINEHLQYICNEILNVFTKYTKENEIKNKKLLDLSLMNLISSLIISRNIAEKIPVDRQVAFFSRSLKSIIKDKFNQGKK